MKIIMQTEILKDKTKKVKRALWVTVMTDIPGLEKVSSVAELPDDSTLAKEMDWIVTEILAQKKKSLVVKNKKLVAKMKK